MNEKTLKSLEYGAIKELLLEKASSNLGKEHIRKMVPSINPKVILNQFEETLEAVNILEINKSIPLGGIRDISMLYTKVEIGTVLRPTELLEICDFLRCMRNFKKFMMTFEFEAPRLYNYSISLTEIKGAEQEIEYCIEGSIVSSRASSKLDKLRKKISQLEEKVVKKLDLYLSNSSNAKLLQDTYYSNKNGRYVLPIKSECRKQVDGTIVETSSSGSTVYMELESVKEISNEIAYHKGLEEEECYQVLTTLTGIIASSLDQITVGIDLLGRLDFIFAKAKFSVDIGGREIELRDDESMDLKGLKHPLLGKSCKAIDVKIGGLYRSLIITGPNTGGKTITLKMVGLAVLLVQSGILPPVAEGSSISIFNKVYVDIGDSQNIEQSLSTFSGHMENLVLMLKKSSRRTLIIIDEIGTGTDPREGAALGCAILEEFYNRGAITLATTHYGEIKDFTDLHDGFVNASMDFNKETLEPYYKLLIGVAGSSNAFYISSRLGLTNEVIERSKELMVNSCTNIKKADLGHVIDDDNESEDKNISAKAKVIRTKTRSFTTKKDRVEMEKATDNNGNLTTYKKGDRVIINDTKKPAIIYDCDLKAKTAKVFIEGKFEEVFLKRLTFERSRDELYPPGYDLDQLFISFKVRKLEKDIKKGRFKNLDELKERMSNQNK
ncbi:MAG: endonuclease MutS2 [Acidaminobacteraceae bacterium]